MYAKLALRNIRRSLRDYIIYFVTLTLTAALMYSFLALGFSSDVLAMAENMSMLTTGILLMSALVAFMSSFVIGYAIRFMLGRRKKEFATYELIGMEAKTVRNLFLAENSIIGTGAFLLGSLVGTGLSGLLNQVVKNIFEVPHTYQVSFSLQAWAVTFLFFALMYGFGMLRAAKIIRHQKVIDLLYDNRKNEEYHFKSFRHSLLVVLLSIAAMVAGVILLGRMLQTQTNEAFLYLGGACLLILVGVYELHRQIQAGLAADARDDRVRALLAQDTRHILQRQRLHVHLVRDGGIRHDRGRVGVDENDLVALLLQMVGPVLGDGVLAVVDKDELRLFVKGA
jgi:putative ABC transport system permease protein